MSDQSPLQKETQAVIEVLRRGQPFTERDLQLLRENANAASSLSGKSDYFVFRMEIELIDAIRRLNESSTRLARVAIGVGVLAVILTVVQVSVQLWRR